MAWEADYRMTTEYGNFKDHWHHSVSGATNKSRGRILGSASIAEAIGTGENEKDKTRIWGI